MLLRSLLAAATLILSRFLRKIHVLYVTVKRIPKTPLKQTRSAQDYECFYVCLIVYLFVFVCIVGVCARVYVRVWFT